MSAPTTVEWLRTAVARISVGSGRLSVHIGRRAAAYGLRRGKSMKAGVEAAAGFDKGLRIGLLVGALFLARKVGTAIARWAYHRIESGAWGPFLFAAAGVWIVAAYRCGRPGWEPKQRPAKDAPEAAEVEPEDVEEQPVETPQPEPAKPPAVVLEKPPLPTLEAFLGAMAKVGTPHAHLSVLAPELGTTPERLREALTGWCVPVQDVRMPGRSASTGVRGDRLPRLPAPSGDVVGAGQAPTTTTTAGGANAGEGLWVEPIGLGGRLVHDPRDTARSHQVRGQ